MKLPAPRRRLERLGPSVGHGTDSTWWVTGCGGKEKRIHWIDWLAKDGASIRAGGNVSFSSTGHAEAVGCSYTVQRAVGPRPGAQRESSRGQSLEAMGIEVGTEARGADGVIRKRMRKENSVLMGAGRGRSPPRK